MTPDQIDTVQQTFAAVTGPETDYALARRFYHHLFEDSPESRALFSTDPAVQRRKFTQELDTIVWSITNLGEFLSTTRALGARHVGYGTTAEHYPLVGDALLRAIADQLGDGYTPEVADAWRAAYDLVAESMMMGAADAAQPGRR
jgi:nitric oxide dioxygenase